MSSAQALAIAEKIFSHAVFKEVDKQQLVDRYDVSGLIQQINLDYGVVTGQQLQTETEISNIPPQGIVINTPGVYRFSQDIFWAPVAYPAAAICICADNVTLDLAGFSLSATVQDNSQHISGVVISNAVGVSIENGTLLNMGMYGIRAEQVQQLMLNKLLISGLQCHNLNIRNLSPAGIHLNQGSGISITDCIVQYMFVTADSSAGIQLLHIKDAVISGCQVRHLINYDGSVQGYSYLCCTDVNTFNCNAGHFQSLFGGNIRTGGHTVLGFIPIFCADLVYDQCSASYMTGCSDDCHGMSVFLDVGVKVSHFTARHITDGVTPAHTGAKATGLEVYGVAVSVSHCTVDQIKAINPQDKQSTGFSAWGLGISFDDCKASNVVVCDEYGNLNAELGYGTGFGWAPDPRIPFRLIGAVWTSYKNCYAEYCQVGFDTWFHIDSSWLDIKHRCCDIAVLVQPGQSRVLSGNPASECNPPIQIAIKNIASGNTYPEDFINEVAQGEKWDLSSL